MGTLFGYLLGRRRERPDVEWGHQLDAHADELRRAIEELERQNSVLWDAVEAAERVVPQLRPADDVERQHVNDLHAALSRTANEAQGDG